MITIHAANADDFSGLGLGVLIPTECTIEEVAGGMFELTMTHPMDPTKHWWNLVEGRVICAPTPIRETPLINLGQSGAVARQIYRVTASKLNMRTKGSTSTGKIIRSYKRGTEVIKLDETSSWMRVAIKKGGATGWMSKSYLAYVRTENGTVNGDKPDGVVEPRQTREQLFRIVSVQRDSEQRCVNVTAQHIFYDLKGNIVKDKYEPKAVAAGTAIRTAWDKLLNPHEFELYITAEGTITGDYTRKSIIETYLDPDEGMVIQSAAKLVRDNFEVFILKDEIRDLGVQIRHGKNLIGATLEADISDVVTRIIPIGKNKKGDPLLLSGTQYIDSPKIGDYPAIYSKAIEYDVQVGQDGINTDNQARTKLQALVAEDYSNGIDSPTLGLEVDFIFLEQTEEYARYADLQTIHLYDTVQVIDTTTGVSARIRMTGYTFDAIRKRYTSVTLGELQEMETTVYGYSIADGSTPGSKLITGSVSGAKLRDLDIHEAKIAEAAITEAKIADAAITRAKIAEAAIGEAQIDNAAITNAKIKDGEIESAKIKNGAITNAKIEDAAITRAKIGSAAIGSAQIEDAVITGAKIADATISGAKIVNASIGTAQIEQGAITTALIGEGVVGEAQIADASITDAKIVGLTASKITAGTIDAAEIEVVNLKAANITVGTINGQQIAPGAISVGHLKDGAVTNSKIDFGAIAANKLNLTTHMIF